MPAQNASATAAAATGYAPGSATSSLYGEPGKIKAPESAPSPAPAPVPEEADTFQQAQSIFNPSTSIFAEGNPSVAELASGQESSGRASSLGQIVQSTGEGSGGAAKAATNQPTGAAAPPPGTTISPNGQYYTTGNGVVYSTSSGQPLYAANPNQTLVGGVPVGGNSPTGQSVSPNSPGYVPLSQVAASQAPAQAPQQSSNPLNNATVLSNSVALGPNSPANVTYYSPGGTITYYSEPATLPNPSGDGTIPNPNYPGKGQVETLTEADLNPGPTQSQQIDYQNFGRNAKIQVTGNQYSGSYVQNGQTYNFNGTLPTTALKSSLSAQNAAVDAAYGTVTNAAQNIPLYNNVTALQGYIRTPININSDTGQTTGGELIQAPQAASPSSTQAPPTFPGPGTYSFYSGTPPNESGFSQNAGGGYTAGYAPLPTPVSTQYIANAQDFQTALQNLGNGYYTYSNPNALQGSSINTINQIANQANAQYAVNSLQQPQVASIPNYGTSGPFKTAQQFSSVLPNPLALDTLAAQRLQGGLQQLESTLPILAQANNNTVSNLLSKPLLATPSQTEATLPSFSGPLGQPIIASPLNSLNTSNIGDYYNYLLNATGQQNAPGTIPLGTYNGTPYDLNLARSFLLAYPTLNAAAKNTLQPAYNYLRNLITQQASQYPNAQILPNTSNSLQNTSFNPYQSAVLAANRYLPGSYNYNPQAQAFITALQNNPLGQANIPLISGLSRYIGTNLAYPATQNANPFQSAISLASVGAPALEPDLALRGALGFGTASTLGTALGNAVYGIPNNYNTLKPAFEQGAQFGSIAEPAFSYISPYLAALYRSSQIPGYLSGIGDTLAGARLTAEATGVAPSQTLGELYNLNEGLPWYLRLPTESGGSALANVGLTNAGSLLTGQGPATPEENVRAAITGAVFPAGTSAADTALGLGKYGVESGLAAIGLGPKPTFNIGVNQAEALASVVKLIPDDKDTLVGIIEGSRGGLTGQGLQLSDTDLNKLSTNQLKELLISNPDIFKGLGSIVFKAVPDDYVLKNLVNSDISEPALDRILTGIVDVEGLTYNQKLEVLYNLIENSKNAYSLILRGFTLGNAFNYTPEQILREIVIASSDTSGAILTHLTNDPAIYQALQNQGSTFIQPSERGPGAGYLGGRGLYVSVPGIDIELNPTNLEYGLYSRAFNTYEDQPSGLGGRTLPNQYYGIQYILRDPAQLLTMEDYAKANGLENEFDYAKANPGSDRAKNFLFDYAASPEGTAALGKVAESTKVFLKGSGENEANLPVLGTLQGTGATYSAYTALPNQGFFKDVPVLQNLFPTVVRGTYINAALLPATTEEIAGRLKQSFGGQSQDFEGVQHDNIVKSLNDGTPFQRNVVRYIPVDNNGDIILVHEQGRYTSIGKPIYSLPGGAYDADAGESALTSKELSQELSLNANNAEKQFDYTGKTKTFFNTGGRFQDVADVLKVNIGDQTPQLSSDEIDGIKVYKPGQEIVVDSDTKGILNKYYTNQNIDLSKIQIQEPATNPLTQLQTGQKAFFDLDGTLIDSKGNLRPGVTETLNYLKSRGIELGLFTHSGEARAVGLLAKAGLSDYFNPDPVGTPDAKRTFVTRSGPSVDQPTNPGYTESTDASTLKPINKYGGNLLVDDLLSDNPALVKAYTDAGINTQAVTKYYGGQSQAFTKLNDIFQSAIDKQGTVNPTIESPISNSAQSQIPIGSYAPVATLPTFNGTTLNTVTQPSQNPLVQPAPPNPSSENFISPESSTFYPSSPEYTNSSGSSSLTPSQLYSLVESGYISPAEYYALVSSNAYTPESESASYELQNYNEPAYYNPSSYQGYYNSQYPYQNQYPYSYPYQNPYPYAYPYPYPYPYPNKQKPNPAVNPNIGGPFNRYAQTPGYQGNDYTQVYSPSFASVLLGITANKEPRLSNGELSPLGIRPIIEPEQNRSQTRI